MRRLFAGFEFRLVASLVGGAFGRLVTVDEFQDSDRCIVAMAVAGFQHAGVAAIAVLVALAEDVEQLADSIFVADLGEGLTAGSEVTEVYKWKRQQM